MVKSYNIAYGYMLRVVIKTEIPKECYIECHGDVMIIKRVQTDKDGRVKALVTFKPMNMHDIIIRNYHECQLAKVLFGSGAIVLSAQVKKDEIFWTLACTWEEFRNVVESLDNSNINYELVWKSAFFEDNKKLSFRELEILKYALEYGYFDSPKKIKLRELAEMLDVSEATASNLIRKALRKVVEQEIINHLP